jgi:heavy-metal-associated domain protein
MIGLYDCERALHKMRNYVKRQVQIPALKENDPMCKDCGCGEIAESTTHIQFFVRGYTEENAAVVQNALLGLPGVLYVHIHVHDGETTVDYSPAKTKLSEIARMFETHGLVADI